MGRAGGTHKWSRDCEWGELVEPISGVETVSGESWWNPSVDRDCEWGELVEPSSVE